MIEVVGPHDFNVNARNNFSNLTTSASHVRVMQDILKIYDSKGFKFETQEFCRIRDFVRTRAMIGSR